MRNTDSPGGSVVPVAVPVLRGSPDSVVPELTTFNVPLNYINWGSERETEQFVEFRGVYIYLASYNV